MVLPVDDFLVTLNDAFYALRHHFFGLIYGRPVRSLFLIDLTRPITGAFRFNCGASPRTQGNLYTHSFEEVEDGVVDHYGVGTGFGV